MWLRDYAAKLQRHLVRDRIISAGDVTFHDTGNGRQIILPWTDPSGGGGGVGVGLRPFQVVVVADPEAEPDADPMPMKIRVVASTLAGGSSTGGTPNLDFNVDDDAEPYLLPPSEGILRGGITLDADGLVTSRWLEIVSEWEKNTEDTFYVEIGTVAAVGDSWRANNSRYGPIDAQICRNWFATGEEGSPIWTVTFLGTSAEHQYE